MHTAQSNQEGYKNFSLHLILMVNKSNIPTQVQKLHDPDRYKDAIPARLVYPVCC